MDLEHLSFLAHDFLNFYIRGSTFGNSEAQFPGSHETGIRLREPATVDSRPEYTAVALAEEHHKEFPAGDGPEESQEGYLYLDRCGLEFAQVSESGEGININFIFVTRYIAGTFQDHEQKKITILLPSSTDVISSIISECIHRLEEYIGEENGEALNISASSEIVSKEVFDSMLQNGDL